MTRRAMCHLAQAVVVVVLVPLSALAGAGVGYAGAVLPMRWPYLLRLAGVA